MLTSSPESIRDLASLVGLCAVRTGPPGARAHPPSPGEGAPRNTSGEPYRLAGNRIVFTNWFYVRPGILAWVDGTGHAVSASRQAVIDDWGADLRTFDMPRGVRLAARPASRRSDVIVHQRPWEKRFSVATLIQEGDKLRFWGGCPRECYLQSADGVAWQRPSLGLVEFEGSRDNNLCPAVPGGFLFLDPSAPEAERYKALGVDTITEEEFETYRQARPHDWEHRAMRQDEGRTYALKGFTSPDGLHWTFSGILSVEHADTQNTGYYDEALHKYVLYTRTWWVGDQDPGARGSLSPDASWFSPGRRSIGRSESPHFGDFPVSQAILVPPPDLLPSEVLYTNCKTTVPGRPDNHLMFPAVWNMDSDDTRIAMLSSTDGRVWQWLPEGTVLKTGPFGSFDGGAIFASPNLVEFGNGDFALPHNGYRLPHKYPRGGEGFPPNLGFAIWEKGRICALEAEGQGEFTTVGFIPPGNRLRINAVTKRGGSILVEVCALNYGCSDLKPIAGRSLADCKPVIGDQYRSLVTWGEAQDMGVAPGVPLALRFRLNQASIYALEFG